MDVGRQVGGIDDVPGDVAGIDLRLQLGDFGRTVVEQRHAGLVDEFLESGHLAVLIDAAIGDEGQRLALERAFLHLAGDRLVLCECG